MGFCVPLNCSSASTTTYHETSNEVVNTCWWQEIDQEAVNAYSVQGSAREQILDLLLHGPMISSKQGVLVSGGQFTQHNYHGQVSMGNKAPIDILTDAIAPNAFHDSAARFDPPKCHPQTRVKILEIIMRWIVGEDEDAQAVKRFLWLNGAAGCGKSAIAQSTIDLCIERDIPLASFFFSRSDSTRNHAESLVATLAYQLYCSYPETEVQTKILSMIQRDPMIFKRTFQRQFTALVIQPLIAHFSKTRPTQHQGPFFIVIDGLDECINRADQKVVLFGLAESFRKFNLSIAILIASRPEHDIKHSFGSGYLKDMHTSLSLDLDDGRDADSDIRLYLFDKFAEIKDDFDNRTTGRKLVQGWPGEGVIENLVTKSSGQFVYAATVIRYVESTRHRPDHRLDIVLKLRPDNGDRPFAELDALYAMILECVLDIEKVLHVLSLYLMNVPSICCSVIEKMLLYDEGEVEALFCDMGALVQIFKRKDPFPMNQPSFLRILHASLADYLIDAERSKQFYIDMDQEVLRHVARALQYLASYGSNSFDSFSDAGTPIYLLDRVQYQIGSRIRQITIPPELQQSVLFFPLKEFLEPQVSAYTFKNHLLRNFVSPFLDLLEAVMLNDPSLSYIQDRQLEILRSVLMPKIQQYFNSDMEVSILVLFYYLGQTPEYIIGPAMHERAALFCFKELARLIMLLPPSPFGKSTDIATVMADDAEDDAYPNLKLRAAVDGGQWYFQDSSLDSRLYDGKMYLEMYFFLLGYAIFLLPRCLRSDALVTACQEHKRLCIDQPDGPFPIRRRLLQKEIDNYLSGVLPIPCV
ncbi:hypothetical protein D9613_006335 [Agrocybe pediades]|uniref:Nephrocystin 3-like N-terminal domain-containing protein n=1 Tax=Agrocybe pediades TaxID=84607 RepID=A0A8H4QUW8_9AGAR|nr:hypothetical protein D9613_006335 [Agrocybe pediades]